MSAAENGNGQIQPEVHEKMKSSWVMTPRDFIYKYLPYVPWLVFSIILFGTLAYLKIRYSVPIYRVQSSILIKDERSGSSKDERFQELFLAQGATNLSNEIEILKSRPVMQRVARDLGLQLSYYGKGSVKTSLFYPGRPFNIDVLHMADSSAGFDYRVTASNDKKFMLDESKKTYDFGEIIENGGNRFRLLLPDETRMYAFRPGIYEVNWQPLANAAENLIGGLQIVQTNDQATILTLSFMGENRALGSDVLNTLMAVYDTLMIEDKNRIANNTLRFINARLSELSDTLKGVQGGLKNFMVENQIFDVESQSKVYLDKMDESAKNKSEMEVKILTIDYLLQYVRDDKNVHNLVPVDLGINEPALLQLVTEFNRIQLDRENNLRTTPASNPLIISMDNTSEKIRRSMIQALLNVRQAYAIASNNVNKRDQDLHGKVTSLPGKSMQMLNIGRQQKIFEDLYSLLLQKKLDISLSSASTISNSRIVESAVASGAPVSPDGKKIYTLYILIGIMIPVAIVALREILQDKVNSRADVEKYTDAPILGEIGHSDDEQPLVVTQNSRRLISEQFRIIRTNLQYIVGKKENPVIMVTSSFSGEGKSFISTNIGAVMALSGKKTVIMEFDIRKPKIVSGLDLKRKMGITNYIIGKARFDELPVKVAGTEDLYVIPCGPIPPNPAEILLDKRLDMLMQEVKANFEVIIMDTAPVGLVSDASTLGQYADCTMYIIRQGHTFRNQVRLIDDLYKNKKLPSLCLLLNDIKVTSGYYGGGYYGRGYGYYGGYGYGNNAGYFEDEKNPKKRTAFKRFVGFITSPFK